MRNNTNKTLRSWKLEYKTGEFKKNWWKYFKEQETQRNWRSGAEIQSKILNKSGLMALGNKTGSLSLTKSQR